MTAPDDESRVRAAIDLIGEDPSPESLAMLKSGRPPIAGRYVLILVVAAIVGGGVGYFTAAGRGRRSGAGDPAAWRDVLGWALWIIGVLGCVWLVVQMFRNGFFRRGRLRWLRVLTFPQRRSLVRQVQGRDPVQPAQLPLTRGLASTMIQRTPSGWGAFAVVTIIAGNTVRSNSVSQWAAAIAFAVLGTLGALSSRRQLNRARAFLRGAHPVG